MNWNSPTEVKEYYKQYYKNNQKELNEYHREYWAANPEYRQAKNDYRTTWREKNRERTNAQAREAARKKKLQWPEYSSYSSARNRCNNPHCPRYECYGGRGIKFLYTSFEQFIADVGRKPTPKHSLDRINNDGNYEPGNCRWATLSEQARNKSRYKNIYGQVN